MNETQEKKHTLRDSVEYMFEKPKLEDCAEVLAALVAPPFFKSADGLTGYASFAKVIPVVFPHFGESCCKNLPIMCLSPPLAISNPFFSHTRNHRVFDASRMFVEACYING